MSATFSGADIMAMEINMSRWPVAVRAAVRRDRFELRVRGDLFPGTQNGAEAQKITLGGSGEPSHDFALLPVKLARSPTVISSEGKPVEDR